VYWNSPWYKDTLNYTFTRLGSISTELQLGKLGACEEQQIIPNGTTKEMTITHIMDINLRHEAPLHVVPLTYEANGVNGRSPSVRYHSIHLFLWFQSIWCWAMGSLFGRTLVSTIVTKNRWRRPLSILANIAVSSLKGVTARNNLQILQ